MMVVGFQVVIVTKWQHNVSLLHSPSWPFTGTVFSPSIGEKKKMKIKANSFSKHTFVVSSLLLLLLSSLCLSWEERTSCSTTDMTCDIGLYHSWEDCLFVLHFIVMFCVDWFLLCFSRFIFCVVVSSSSLCFVSVMDSSLRINGLYIWMCRDCVIVVGVVCIIFY